MNKELTSPSKAFEGDPSSELSEIWQILEDLHKNLVSHAVKPEDVTICETLL